MCPSPPAPPLRLQMYSGIEVGSGDPGTEESPAKPAPDEEGLSRRWRKREGRPDRESILRPLLAGVPSFGAIVLSWDGMKSPLWA